MKRAWVVVTLMTGLLAVPVPAQGHTVTVGGKSGFEMWLMLPGLIAIAAAIAYHARKGSRRAVSGAFIAIGVVLIASSLVVPRLDDGSASAAHVTVQVVQPKSGATVEAGKPIRIEAQVTGADVAQTSSSTDAGHFHVFVDGELQEMLYSAGTEVKLSPGPHTITVEYTDPQHLSFDPPIEDSVEVTAE